jgi:hypothetical protein
MRFRDTAAYEQLVEAVWRHRRESDACAHVHLWLAHKRDNPHQPNRRRPR